MLKFQSYGAYKAWRDSSGGNSSEPFAFVGSDASSWADRYEKDTAHRQTSFTHADLIRVAEAMREMCRKTAAETPRYTTHDVGVAGIKCEVSTSPYAIAEKIGMQDPLEAIKKAGL